MLRLPLLCKGEFIRMFCLLVGVLYVLGRIGKKILFINERDIRAIQLVM